MDINTYLIIAIGVLLVGILFVNSIETTPTAEFTGITHSSSGSFVRSNSQAKTQVTIINTNAVTSVTVEEE